MVAISSRPTTRPTASRKLQPVQWWAGFGAATFAFVAYLLIRWVTGPNFKRVPVGPSEPPAAMTVVLNTGQILLSVTAIVVVYWFLVRPWRQGRGLTTDGLLVLCFAGAWWIDPVGNYFGHWIVYNAYLPNRGSWVAEVPGWNAFAAPGATTVEPFPFLPGNVHFTVLPDDRRGQQDHGMDAAALAALEQHPHRRHRVRRRLRAGYPDRGVRFHAAGFLGISRRR